MAVLVREAWAAALAPLECDFGQTWQESGGDSQAIVYLVSGLEEALGRRLSYDLFARDVTADELAANLCDEPGDEPEASGAEVFIVPGAFGDEPYVADFVRAFDGRIRLKVIDPADFAEPSAVLLSVPRQGRMVAEEIAAHQPEGPILLAGYSYGGTVAFEAARWLAAAGSLQNGLTVSSRSVCPAAGRADRPRAYADGAADEPPAALLLAKGAPRHGGDGLTVRGRINRRRSREP